MEQGAASSEEQSASTQEIAAEAGTLATAADRLSKLVANLKLGEETRPMAPTPPPVRLASGRTHGGTLATSS